MDYLEICLDFEQIEMCTEYQFRNLVHKSIEEKCFDYLNEEKNKKNKVKHIHYQKHELQKYLMPGKISNHQAKKQRIISQTLSHYLLATIPSCILIVTFM